MKKNFKTLLALLLFVAVMVSMVACTQKTDETAGGDKKQAGDVATGSSDGEIKISFWHHNNTEPMRSIFREAFDRFEADHPGVKVDENLLSNDSYKQKLAITMSSQQIPDVFFSWGGGTMLEYIKSGNIIDLTDFMNKDNYKDRFLDAAISQASYDGKIYGYPAGGCSSSVVFYNKDIFNKLGLEEPKTIEELEEIAEKLKEAGYTPFALANKAPWTGSMYFMNLATRLGGLQPYIDATTGKGSFESENFIKAAEIIQDWVKRGFFNEGFNGADDDSGQARRLLINEDCAMTVNGNWMLGEMMNDDPDFTEKLGVFAFPAVKGLEENSKLVIGTVGGNFYHVSSKAEHPELCFELLTYLLDEPSVERRVNDAKSIVALKGLELGDPKIQKNFEILSQAEGVQLWYDQDLPPEVAQVHLQTVQEIFGLTMTPEEAASKLQEAMQKYLDKQSK